MAEKASTSSARPYPGAAFLRAWPHMLPGSLLTWMLWASLDGLQAFLLSCMSLSLCFAGAAKCFAWPQRSLFGLWVERGTTYILSGVSLILICLPLAIAAALALEWFNRRVPELAVATDGVILLAFLCPLVWRLWPGLFLGWVAEYRDGHLGTGKNRHVWYGPGISTAWKATGHSLTRPMTKIAFGTVLAALATAILLDLEAGPHGDKVKLAAVSIFGLLPWVIGVLMHEAHFAWITYKMDRQSRMVNEPPPLPGEQPDPAAERRRAAARQEARERRRPASHPRDHQAEWQEPPDESEFEEVVRRCGGEDPILYCLAQSKDEQWNRKLLRHGSNPNWRDSYGDTALHVALRNRRPEIVRHLLKLGADVNAANNGNGCPMHVAGISPEGAALIPDLIKRGADVNVLDNFEETPLQRAVGSSCLAGVKMLLKHGAELGIPNHRGETAMHQAARWTPRPRDRPVRVAEHLDIIDILHQAGLAVDAPNQRGNQPVHVAAEHGLPEVLQKLLNLGAAPNARDQHMRTPLQRCLGNRDTTKMRLLRDAGADLDLYSATALGDLATLRSRTAQVRELREDPGDWRLPSLVGIAVHYREFEVLDWLLSLGMTAWGRGVHMGPLMTAVRLHQDVRLARQLLQAGAQIYEYDGDGRTALHEAASQGSEPLVRLLMEFGADPNAMTERNVKAIDCTRDPKLRKLMGG